MSRPRIPAAAWWLGAVSFVNDAASEMVLPLLPALMVGSLGLPAASLGAIEGVASAVASGLKLAFGRLGDRTGKHRALMVGGYAVSNLVRPLLALATGGVGVAVLRVADRVGKGLRSAPRDALLAASTPREAQAAAFSVHRGLDHAGTILGAAAAALLLRYGGFSPAEVFGWSAVPGVLVVVLAVLAVRSPGWSRRRRHQSPSCRARGRVGCSPRCSASSRCRGWASRARCSSCSSPAVSWRPGRSRCSGACSTS